MRSKWDVYEFLKKQQWSNESIDIKRVVDNFKELEPEEISEGIEEYKAAKWLHKAA